MNSKNKIILIFIIILNFLISSCALYPPRSPAIYFSNVSNDYIRNVKGNLNGYYLHDQTRLIPSKGASQIFNVESKKDIFGPVHLEWENASGKKFTKDFIFTKEELPTYLKSEWEISRMKKQYKKNIRAARTVEDLNKLRNPTYFYVNFYFTQNGIEYFTSDHPDIEVIEKEKHNLAEKSFREFRKKYPNGN